MLAFVKWPVAEIEIWTGDDSTEHRVDKKKKIERKHDDDDDAENQHET